VFVVEEEGKEGKKERREEGELNGPATTTPVIPRDHAPACVQVIFHMT
jgi:hypothetical protein